MAKKRVDITDRQPWDGAGNPELADQLVAGIITPDEARQALGLSPDERTYRTSFVLPYGVLVALIDSDHPDADVDGAEVNYGLIVETGDRTKIGQLVLSGIDQTAIRHKMLAGWRAQHNAEVDSDKTGFKKA